MVTRKMTCDVLHVRLLFIAVHKPESDVEGKQSGPNFIYECRIKQKIKVGEKE